MNETIKATLTADGSQFQREFQKSQSTVTNFQKGMATAAKAIGTFFAGRALLNTFNAMRNEIDELGKTATRLRMPVEQVQILSVAADQGGTDIDNLVKALNRAQVAATEAGRGTATYTREFDALNINIAEFQKLNHQDRLNVLADAYGNAADKGEAFTSLSRIMGRSVSDLIPLLEGGSKALEELAGKVNVVDESQVRRIEEFNDRITLLSGNLKTNLMEAFMALEPQMNSFAKNLGTSFEMIGTIFDDAGGVGRKGDFADVLQTLREINALGGEGNEGKGLGKLLRLKRPRKSRCRKSPQRWKSKKS